MKAVRTLVLIANERKTVFLENTGVGRGLVSIAEQNVSEIHPERLEFADDKGHSKGGHGGQRHDFEAVTPEREQLRGAFADFVIAGLRQQWRAGSYDRLVISAPPKMLGELRARLGDLASFLYADLDKDLLKIPHVDLPRHFDSVAAF